MPFKKDEKKISGREIKRIGIDARFYGPIGKGLGRYTQEIVDHITEIDQDNKYVIFLRKENFEEFVCDGIRVKKILIDISWYSLKEQIVFPYYIWREKLDLMHFPHFNVPILCPTKFIVTIHDLILIKFPTKRATTLSPLFYKIKHLAYKIIIFLAVKRARKIITVSNFTKNDILDQFKISPSKFIVTYEGAANLAKNRDTLFEIKPDDKEVLSEYNINKPFLLYVGNAYPHKNLEGLIRVFCKISKAQTSLRLVLVGKEEYFYNRLKKYAKDFGPWGHGSVSTILFPGYVPDDKLEILYKNALAYVFPSYYEGFGLPPLEAMAKGLPIISSNSSSMPEVLGNAAVYFNPASEEEMQEKIELIIKDGELRRQLIKKGYQQIKKYSWWECARETLEVYKNILKN